MSRGHKFDVRRLLSSHRAIVSTEGLYRLQFMPSGRIMEEMVASGSAKIIKIITEEINASNKTLMKRREKLLSKLRKSRKKARKGGAA